MKKKVAKIENKRTYASNVLRGLKCAIKVPEEHKISFEIVLNVSKYKALA